MLRNREKTEASRWLLPFLIGLFSGCLLWNGLGRNWLDKLELFSPATLERVGEYKIAQTSYFWYVLQDRLTFLWFLFLVSVTVMGAGLLYVLVAWVGFSTGILYMTAVLRYGLEGVFLVVVSCLPQYLFYVPAFFLALNTGYTFCKRIRRRGTGETPYKKTDLLYTGLRFLACHGLVVVGVLLESYVNPELVTRVLTALTWVSG